MKTRIVSKNALRMEGTDFVDHGMSDYEPIIIGKIGLVDITNPVTSGSALLMFDVYLFSMNLKNAI